jgi:hypothetical protein
MYVPHQSRRRAVDILLKSLERGDVGESTLCTELAVPAANTRRSRAFAMIQFRSATNEIETSSLAG